MRDKRFPPLGRLSGLLGENIRDYQAVDNNSISLPASRILIGESLFENDADLVLNLNNSGIGGIDNGTRTTGNWYFIYAVPNGKTYGIVASNNRPAPYGSGPIGFPTYRYLGLIPHGNGEGGNDMLHFMKTGSTIIWHGNYLGNTSMAGTGARALATASSTTVVDYTPTVGTTPSDIPYDRTLYCWVGHTTNNNIPSHIQLLRASDSNGISSFPMGDGTGLTDRRIWTWWGIDANLHKVRVNADSAVTTLNIGITGLIDPVLAATGLNGGPL